MQFAGVFRIPRCLTLAPLVLLVSADPAPAQQLRGPPIALRPSTFQTFAPPGPGVQPFGPAIGPQFSPTGPGNQVGARYTAQLMPGKGNIPLLNNGSLQVSQNPALPGTPNVQPFSYIAALPIGDRLGANGVFYNPTFLPNVGFTPSAPNFPGFPGPIAPYPYQAIAGDGGARRRMAGYSMYAATMQMQMAAFAQPQMGFGGGMPMGFGPQMGPMTVYGAVGDNNAALLQAGFFDPNQNAAFAGFANQGKDDKQNDKKKDN